MEEETKSKQAWSRNKRGLIDSLPGTGRQDRQLFIKQTCGAFFFFFLLSRQTHSEDALLRNTFLSMLSLYS